MSIRQYPNGRSIVIRPRDKESGASAFSLGATSPWFGVGARDGGDREFDYGACSGGGRGVVGWARVGFGGGMGRAGGGVFVGWWEAFVVGHGHPINFKFL